MSRLAPFALVPLLALLIGCPTFEGPPYSYSPHGVDCPSNNPPAIGNVELNSFYVEEFSSWMLSVHFDWVDPGVSGASDPPNMRGGRFTAETLGATTPDIDLTADVLERACTWPSTEEDGVDPCVLANHGTTGCPVGGTDTCTQGEVTVPLLPDFLMVEDDVIELEFRVRDACDATSNEKSATYVVGSGKAVEGGDEGEGA